MAQYPVHNYGTDQMRGGVQSWVQAKAQKESAMLQAIMQSAPYMNDFGPGNPAYNTLEKKLGPDVTKAFANQASAQKNQREVQARIAAFDMGSKVMSGAESIKKIYGDDAVKLPAYREMMKKASEYYKSSGVNWDYNDGLTYEENMVNFKKESLNSLQKMSAQIDSSKEVTPTMLKNFEVAITKYRGTKGSDEKIAGFYESKILEMRKSIIEKEKEKRANAEYDRRERLKQSTAAPTTTGIMGNIFQKIIDGVPLGEGEAKLFERQAKGQGLTQDELYERTRVRLKAKTDEFESQMGRAASPDEKRRLFLADPYGILAPQTELQAEQFKIGDTKEVNGKTYKYLGDDKWQEQ